jgi:hypothetical protein
MSNTRSQYIFFRRVGQALAPYQLLEAFLKIYIGRAHLRIKGILDGKVPFHYPTSEYENAPLERLVTMFQRHSNNKALIKRLRAATKTRNYIAHGVIEHYMEHHERIRNSRVKFQGILPSCKMTAMISWKRCRRN